VVLDTSVLVSAFFTPHGTSAAVLRRLRDPRFELVVSPAILGELARILRTTGYRRRFPYADEAIRAYVRELLRVSVSVRPLPLSGVVRDRDDDVILATALSAQAPYLVTGDRDLLVLERYRDVEIVSPRSFLDRLEERA
jgi:putative PIN family toxin of toxin-antitoxin system